MGIIKDMLDAVKDIANTTKDASGIMKDRTKTSISKEASEGTLQFPVLVSRSLDMETSGMVAKALEKNYASFVQIVLSMNPTFSFDSGKGVSDFLRQFHQNTDTKTNVFDIKNTLVSIGNENLSIAIDEKNNSCILSIITEGGSGKIYHDNINKLRSPIDDINTNIANGVPSVQKEYFINSRLVSNEFNEKYNIVIEAVPSTPRTEKFDLPRDAMKWSQTQKLNELMPTHLIVKVKHLSPEGPLGDIEFVIGIKSTLHPIDSKEMVQNMVAACRNNNTIFNFIKWTTGETSFFKDFLFNLNEIKDDVVNRSTGASSWWITLKRRKTLANLKKFIFLPNNILPNATIVLSMEEVNYIKAEYGFDLMSPYFMDSIMKTYFLLGFVVVDNSTQVVHMMFDGQQNFQSYTFTGLQKEADSKEDFKQMLKLINRI